MKKLMFVAAVAAGMVAFGDAIESQNIVGYQNKAVTEGNYNFMVATFDKVNPLATYTLADISVNDDFVVSTLSFLNPANAATKSFVIDGYTADQFFYYFESDLVGTAFEGQPGWYFVDEDEGNMHSANSIAVPFGSSFYIEGAENAAVVFSGTVANTDTPIDVVEGAYNFMGNCSPANLTLADIGVSDDFVVSTLSFLNPANAATKSFVIDGYTADQFFYYFESDLVGTAFEGQPGWYFVDEDEGNLHSANSIPVNAGDMFYVEGAEDAQVIVPSAL